MEEAVCIVCHGAIEMVRASPAEPPTAELLVFEVAEAWRHRLIRQASEPSREQWGRPLRHNEEIEPWVVERREALSGSDELAGVIGTGPYVRNEMRERPLLGVRCAKCLR